MKIQILVLSFFAATVWMLSSCSSSEEEISNSNVILNEQEAYDLFLAQVDSLTLTYTPQANAQSSQNPAKIKALYSTEKTVVKRLSDAFGRVVGSWMGKVVGASVGTAMANPVVAVGGYVGGRKLGGVVGSIAASYAAGRIYDHYASAHSAKRAPAFTSNAVAFYIPENTTSSEDSLGYIHNQVMAKLAENPERYGRGDNLDYDLIYDDCVRFAKDLGWEDANITYNNQFRTEIVKKTAEVAQLSKLVEQESITLDAYQDSTAVALKKLEVPTEAVALYKDFSIKVAKTSNSMSVAGTKQYADELNTIIDRSLLQESAKAEARATVNIVINSSLSSHNTTSSIIK